ncbi:MAG: FAD:protein FMN transferase [Streptococcaceae bacterium]|nr:FAD:protein FMN transferase [Streptococcaceae bacterium]
MKKKLFYLIPIIALCIIGLSAFEMVHAHSDDRNLMKEAYISNKFMINTPCKIIVYDKDKETVVKNAWKYGQSLADKVDTYDKNNHSQIQEINDNAGVKPVVVDEDVYDVMKKGMTLSKLPVGGYDQSVGTITDLWGIGTDHQKVPTQTEITNALKYVNWQKIQMNDANHSVYLEEKGMKLDLGGTSEGWIGGKIAEYLKEHGVTSGIVNMGGSIYVIGHSNQGKDTPWTVGIQDPTGARETIIGSVPGVDEAFTTAGIYERNITVGDTVYSHIMDPKTGWPYQNSLAGVSIIGKDEAMTDALDDWVFSLGLKHGYEEIAKMKDVNAVFVTKDNKVYVTPGIANDFRLAANSGFVLGDIGDVKE